MAKMRIYEIAKSLNMKSTDLVKTLNEHGFEVKSPQSNIEDEAIAFVLKNFVPNKSEAKENQAEPPVLKNRDIVVTPNLKKEAEQIKSKEPTGTIQEADTEKTKVKKVMEGQTEKSVVEDKQAVSKEYKSSPELGKVTKKETVVNKHESEKVVKNINTNTINNSMDSEVNTEVDKKVKEQNIIIQEKRVEVKVENNNKNSNGEQYEAHSMEKSTEKMEDKKMEQRPTQNRGNQTEEQRNNSQKSDQRNDQRNGQRNDQRSNYTQRNGQRNDQRSDQRGNNTQRNGQNGQRNDNRSFQRNDQGNYNRNNDNRNNDNRNNDNRSNYNRNNDNRTNDNRSNYNRTNDNRGYQRNDNRTGGQTGGQTSGQNGERKWDRPFQKRGDRPVGQGNTNGQRTYNGNNNQRSDNNSFEKRDSRPAGERGPINKDRRATAKPGDRLDKMIAKAEEIQKPNRTLNKGKRQKDSVYKQSKEFGDETDSIKAKSSKRQNLSKGKSVKEEVVVLKKDPNRKGAFIKPKPLAPVVEEAIKSIVIPEVLTIKELADKMKIPAAGIVKKLFLQGKMVSINSEIPFEEAEEIALEYDIITELEEKIDVIEELLKEEQEDESLMVKRPPVVCVMGHVDHGKTSLLDAIRETNVTEREAGGITQHIGAYVVTVNNQTITFLDTPGHEAFTSMRMRGAKSTDIAILVVAADDGVMPQTVEAISHAKAAGIEIIVAINKIDKPSANIERVKQELVEYELVAEDWGGDTIFVPVSAHTKEGIDQLLEMITLTAEIMELKANSDRNARGIVIEAQLDKGRGPVATVLVQKGTLNVGDPIAIGSSYGKVRAMMDDKGRRVKEAGPSTPVEILGLNEVPDAGEICMATENEKEARTIAETYIKQSREKLLDDTKAKLSLDGLFSQIKAGNIKELNIIVKADVQGSVEAVKQSLLKLTNEEVAIRIIHGGVGAVNESDVALASASNAIIIAFNVRPDNSAKDLVDREKVDLRLYKVIYNAIEDIQAAMKGMLDPVFEEKVIGHVEVRQVFKASDLGTIAGSYVLDGKVLRGSSARITREGTLVFEGKLASLKRFKDDVKEVAAGYECGLVFEKFNDIKEMDLVELYIMEEVPR
ncbi:translation initiation factor IF-2 [Anaeromicropila populeti]|uniref:Translation initiation factor IF-2 n=1 Tax=Anaeromicropila populeti TaxID=37658 RepID=A0A1I6JT58_9FIRM|nr:translation initiation factor IF-2 [Anaeromicropila populeti]SFR81730.1 translation initiation factor IF-2 [Anaeromicropila populeti]